MNDQDIIDFKRGYDRAFYEFMPQSFETPKFALALDEMSIGMFAQSVGNYDTALSHHIFASEHIKRIVELSKIDDKHRDIHKKLLISIMLNIAISSSLAGNIQPSQQTYSRIFEIYKNEPHLKDILYVLSLYLSGRQNHSLRLYSEAIQEYYLALEEGRRFYDDGHEIMISLRKHIQELQEEQELLEQDTSKQKMSLWSLLTPWRK